MRRRRLLAALLCALVSGSALPAVIAAQSSGEPAGVTLTLAPVSDATVTGLAVLTPRDADTAANVLAVGAPAGAIAIIHGGTCEAIDPAPVGLLGDVGTTGQLAATVPVSFVVIADGTHVLVVHPGLDLTAALACGVIPMSAGAGASAVPGVSVPPAPTSVPTPAAAVTTPPSPTAEAACAGVDTWVAATLARFDVVKAMADGLTTAMNAGMAAYAQALADDAVGIQRLQIEQAAMAVPATATDAQASVIKMLQKLAEAYDLMAQAYTNGNTGLLQQGLGAASEAQGLATSARTAVRNVATPCGITVPAA